MSQTHTGSSQWQYVKRRNRNYDIMNQSSKHTHIYTLFPPLDQFRVSERLRIFSVGTFASSEKILALRLTLLCWSWFGEVSSRDEKHTFVEEGKHGNTTDDSLARHLLSFTIKWLMEVRTDADRLRAGYMFSRSDVGYCSARVKLSRALQSHHREKLSHVRWGGSTGMLCC